MLRWQWWVRRRQQAARDVAAVGFPRGVVAGHGGPLRGAGLAVGLAVGLLLGRAFVGLSLRFLVLLLLLCLILFQIKSRKEFLFKERTFQMKRVPLAPCPTLPVGERFDLQPNCQYHLSIAGQLDLSRRRDLVPGRGTGFDGDGHRCVVGVANDNALGVGMAQFDVFKYQFFGVYGQETHVWPVLCVGVDVLVTVHEKVTTGKRGWHKVVGTGNVARKGCESVPTTKRVGVVVRTLELGKRAMVVMCLALLWILNLQKNRQ